MASPALTPKQAAALFAILSHHETYAEIELLKQPETISRYGYPFNSSSSPRGSSSASISSRKVSSDSKRSKQNGAPPSSNSKRNTREGPGAGAGSGEDIASSPVLQILLRRLILTLPGIRDIPLEFWSQRVQGLLKRFAEADLSESYDKGAMGTRKTLATAFSAMVEALVRGILGGCPASATNGRAEKYNFEDAASLEKAFNDALHEIVYGDLIDEATEWLAETDDLEGHSPMMAAAIEYEIIHIATLFHQVFILSSEGQYLLKLIEDVHGMLPYGMIRQTLRMSNAATVVAGMVKIFLSKLSIGGISNYIGLTKNANDGINLLQKIISVVLGWDSAEFKKTADQIEKSENSPGKEQLAAIKNHIQGSAEERSAVRAQSKSESKSIVTVILEKVNPELAKGLGESTSAHAKCQEYYAALLAVRDREQITSVLCSQTPDLFTQAVRDVVTGYEPYIRAVHDKVDLREHVQDYQTFVDRFIAASKPKKVEEDASKIKEGKGTATTKTTDAQAEIEEYRSPSVEDYVQLLRDHKHMLYKWFHQGAKQAPEVRDTFRAWAKETIIHFRKPEVPVKGSSSHTEGTVVEGLSAAFENLTEAQKEVLLPVVDAQVEYLDSVEKLSLSRMQQILDGGSETMAGPGIFLMSWQSLLDKTVIGPGGARGVTRRGRDVRHAITEGKTTKTAREGWDGGLAARKEALASVPVGPDVEGVIRVLGGSFRRMVARMEGDGGGESDISID